MQSSVPIQQLEALEVLALCNMIINIMIILRGWEETHGKAG